MHFYDFITSDTILLEDKVLILFVISVGGFVLLKIAIIAIRNFITKESKYIDCITKEEENFIKQYRDISENQREELDNFIKAIRGD